MVVDKGEVVVLDMAEVELQNSWGICSDTFGLKYQAIPPEVE